MQPLDMWKRAAAERITAANPQLCYSGPPPMPLRAVVVVQMQILPDGRLLKAELLRVPDHAVDLGPVALQSLHAAAPLPPVPPALKVQGPLKSMETWLFRDDGKFQLRSLAPEQEQV